MDRHKLARDLMVALTAQHGTDVMPDHLASRAYELADAFRKRQKEEDLRMVTIWQGCEGDAILRIRALNKVETFSSHPTFEENLAEAQHYLQREGGKYIVEVKRR